MKRIYLFLFLAFSTFSVFGQNIDIKRLPFAPDSVNWYNVSFARANNLTQYKSCIGVTPGNRAFFISKNLQYQLLSGTGGGGGTVDDWDVLKVAGAGQGGKPTVEADFSSDKYTKGDLSVNGRGNVPGVRFAVFDSSAASASGNYGFRESRVFAANTNGGAFAFLDQNGIQSKVGGANGSTSLQIGQSNTTTPGIPGAVTETALFDFTSQTQKLTAYGQGDKTATELGLTNSNYIARFATNGTIVESFFDPGEPINIYNSDGALSGNRIVDLNGFELNISGSNSPGGLITFNDAEFIFEPADQAQKNFTVQSNITYLNGDTLIEKYNRAFTRTSQNGVDIDALENTVFNTYIEPSQNRGTTMEIEEGVGLDWTNFLGAGPGGAIVGVYDGGDASDPRLFFQGADMVGNLTYTPTVPAVGSHMFRMNYSKSLGGSNYFFGSDVTTSTAANNIGTNLYGRVLKNSGPTDVFIFDEDKNLTLPGYLSKAVLGTDATGKVIDAAGSVPNIYNSDGAITEDREVDLDGNSLTFNNGALTFNTNIEVAGNTVINAPSNVNISAVDEMIATAPYIELTGSDFNIASSNNLTIGSGNTIGINAIGDMTLDASYLGITIGSDFVINGLGNGGTDAQNIQIDPVTKQVYANPAPPVAITRDILANGNSIPGTGIITTGWYRVPLSLNGYKLTNVSYAVQIAGAGIGTTDLRIDKSTAPVQSVTFNPGNTIQNAAAPGTTVATGDLLRVEVTGNTMSTAPTGLVVTYFFEK